MKTILFLSLFFILCLFTIQLACEQKPIPQAKIDYYAFLDRIESKGLQPETRFAYGLVGSFVGEEWYVGEDWHNSVDRHNKLVYNLF